MAQRAIEKARLSRNPVAIEPGRYTVILEPQAVGDLVQLLAFSLDARSADEGRSPFSKQGGGTKIGEKIVDERVTLFSDPGRSAAADATRSTARASPSHRRSWIENGVLKQLDVLALLGAEAESTARRGHERGEAAPAARRSTEDLIKSTPRGVLVTRLWYLRQVDPRTVLYTGLTRDGTFLIENGKISKAVKNLRFNESPLFMLNNLEANRAGRCASRARRRAATS